MAGGMASFLGASLAPTPKCFLPVGNRPLYHYIAGALGAAGANLLIFCVPEGRKAEVADLLADFTSAPGLPGPRNRFRQRRLIAGSG